MRVHAFSKTGFLRNVGITECTIVAIAALIIFTGMPFPLLLKMSNHTVYMGRRSFERLRAGLGDTLTEFGPSELVEFTATNTGNAVWFSEASQVPRGYVSLGYR